MKYLLTGILLSLPTVAFAHQAPSGWQYPLECCSDRDCMEVADTAIEERPEGYIIKETGEVIPMTDRRIRFSPDGHFHWCRSLYQEHRTFCLFVPPRSF